MADISIPREAVEAGARAMMRDAYAGDDSQWDKLQPTQQHIVRERAMAVLNAAAPLIVAAELERAARDFEVEIDELTDGMDVARGPVVETYLAEVRQFRTRADELRAQS